jgi:hypothetical protein
MRGYYWEVYISLQRLPNELERHVEGSIHDISRHEGRPTLVWSTVTATQSMESILD